MSKASQPNRAIVTVDDSGTIICTPDPLPAIGHNVELMFVLQTDGYVFPQNDAIAPDQPSPEFPTPSRTVPPNNTTALLFDRNSGPGSFPYTVTVRRVATGEVLQRDPTINNGP